MNEEYLQGFFNNYVKTSKPDAVYEDWRDRIKDNDSYKQGMFNSYIKASKPDADYNDWNSKIFGTEERSIFGAIPVIGDVIHYGGKAVEDVVRNQIPKMVATLSLQEQSERLKELQQLLNLPDLSEREKTAIQNEIKYHEESIPKMESFVQEQNKESGERLKGNVQNLTDVNSVGSFMNWLGTSVGQAGGHIPLSAATFGGSSFLMEAAEVYDQQLDLLSKKHGISRQEVIEKGLDKPAEGQSYALLAGALDAISAGKIMGLFKNIAKTGGKELVKSEVKRNLIKEAVKDGVFEAFTEGTQGVLESAGGAAGAGTEYKFNPKQFINEAAAGAVGGGGISLASTGIENPQIQQPHPANNVIDDHNNLINNIKVGDPAIDATLDELSIHNSNEINKLFDTVKEITGEVQGTKQQDQIKSILDEYEKTLTEKQNLERQGSLQELFKRFEETPTILQSHPVSEENELGPQVQEIEYNKLHPEPFKLIDTTVPKYDPNTLDEIGVQPAKEFNFNNWTGDAKGTIVGNAASLDTIYAKKDEQGNPIKGGNLYGNLIDNLKTQGVNKLRIGAQSPASTSILNNLVKRGILEIDNRGDVTIGENTYHTQFNILENKPEIKENDQKNKQGIQSSIRERKESVIGQSIPRGGSEKITPSRILQASQKIEENRRAQEEKILEQKEKVRGKLEKLIQGALKRKPTAKLARLEELAKQADEAGFEDLKSHVATLADRELKRQEKFSENKEIYKKAAEKRKENTKTKEERVAERIQKKEKIKAKEATKKINKPIEGTVIGKGTPNERAATIKETKEAFLKEIAYQRESGSANYKKIAQAYLNFRKKQELKEITIDQAISKATAPEYIGYAKKQLERESRERGSIQRKITSMKKEGKTVEEIQRANEQLHDQIKGALAKILNVRQSDLGELSGYNLSELFTKDVKSIIGEAFDKDKIKRITTNELIEKLKGNETIKSTFSQNLLLAVDKALKKSGKELYVYEYNHSKPAGFHLIGKNIDVILLTKGSLLNTDRQASTALHEIIHGYMSVFASVAFQSNESFARSINRIYDSGKDSYTKNIKNIVDKLLTKARESKKGNLNIPFVEFAKNNLTPEEFNILNATWNYINEFYDSKRESNYLSNFLIGFLSRINIKDKYRDKPTSKAMIDGLSNEILKHIYGFTNQRELLAEGLSSNAFANLLNQIPYESNVVKYTDKKKNNTILQKIFSELRKFVQSHIFSKPSIYDELEHVLTDFDDLYNEEHSNINGIVDPLYKAFTLGDLKSMKEYKGAGTKDLNNLMNLSLDIMSDDEFYEADLKKATMKKMPNLSKSISDNISKTLERRKEIKSEKDVREYIDRVNKNLSEERKLGEFFVNEIWNKIQKMRESRKENIVRYEDSIKLGRNNPKYNESRQYSQNIEDFALVNLEDLNLNKLKIITKGIESLSNNGNVSQEAFNLMITYGKEFNKKRELLKVADKVAKNTSNLVASFSNPSTYASILSRYDKNTASTILKHVYGGLMQTYSNITLESRKFFNELNEIADKHNLIHNNLAKIGIYGSVFSTKSDPENKAEWNKEIIENAKFAVEAAENKIAAREDGKYRGTLSKDALQKELIIAKDLLKQLEKTLEMKNILSEGEQKLYDKFREFTKNHEDDFKRNSIAVWGNDNYVNRFNYFPTMAQGKIKGVLSNAFKADELLSGPEDNLAEALGITSNKIDKNNIYGKKVWSNYQRLNPRGYFYEFDALGIADRWSHKMLFDLYASVEMKTLNRLMKDEALHTAFGEKTMQGFMKQLKSIAGVGHSFREDIHWTAKNLLKIRDTLYTTTLATTGQFLSQSSSGFAAAAVIATNSGLEAPLMFAKAVSATMKSSFSSDTSELQKFLKENGLGIQLRDILFEKYLSPEDYQNYAKTKTAKVLNIVQNATEWGIRAGDKLGARIVWFAAYFNAGGTLEKPSKEAVLEAERWVGMMQNMSDINFSAPAFKYDSTYKKLLFQTFYAFKSFAVNSYINTLYSLRYSPNSPEARTVLTGQLASIAAYHAMAILAVKPLYDIVLNNILGDDGDDDDKEKQFSKGQQIVAETLWDIGGGPLFGMAGVSLTDAFSRYMFNAVVAPKIYKSDNPFEPFDKYTQSPLYSPKELDDVWKQAFGPGAKDIIGLMLETGKLIEAQSQMNDYFLDLDKQDKLEAQKQAYYWQLILMLYGASPYTLLRGDVKKLGEQYIRKQKAQYLKEHPKGSGNGQTGEGGEEPEPIEPEFQEQDYEIINQ